MIYLSAWPYRRRDTSAQGFLLIKYKLWIRMDLYKTKKTKIIKQ